jgi:hypothetical protein
VTSAPAASSRLAGLPLVTAGLAALRLVGEAAFSMPCLVFGAVLKVVPTVLANEEFIFK